MVINDTLTIITAVPRDSVRTRWSISAFLRTAETLYRLVFAQFRTENRFPLFMDSL